MIIDMIYDLWWYESDMWYEYMIWYDDVNDIWPQLCDGGMPLPELWLVVASPWYGNLLQKAPERMDVQTDCNPSLTSVQTVVASHMTHQKLDLKAYC